MTVPNPTVAFFLANMFQQIDVPVSLRHAYDMYRESAASTILEWLADICECHVGGDPDLTTKIMSQVLREDRHQNSGGHRVAPDLRRLLKASEGKPDQPRSRIRLDWMWHIDNRLWKQPKLLTKAIYAKMMTVHPSNMEFMRKSHHQLSELITSQSLFRPLRLAGARVPHGRTRFRLFNLSILCLLALFRRIRSSHGHSKKRPAHHHGRGSRSVVPAHAGRFPR